MHEFPDLVTYRPTRIWVVRQGEQPTGWPLHPTSIQGVFLTWKPLPAISDAQPSLPWPDMIDTLQ